MSLTPPFFTSRLGRYVIAVLAAWMLLFVIGYVRYGPLPGYPAVHVFVGFLLGMLCIYVATRLSGAPRSSLYVTGALVALVVLFTIGYLRYAATPAHPILQVFGGLLLGMLSMSIATRVYGMPPTSSHA